MGEPLAIDSITASVVQGALENIAVEMGHKLMRMSYSSIIRESEDFGAALVDAEGRGLAESAQSTPLQSGPIPGYIRGILKALRERRDAVRPGDVIMHNDAYGGASRGPDVGFAVPVFRDGRLVGFAATTAHHLDIGALSPGSCGIVDAIDAYAEGLQFKAIKVYDRGVRNDAVWQLLRDNIRVSDLVVGDMEAALAARVPSRPFCDFRAAKSSSQRTLCWREMDSNFCCRVCDYAELPRCSEMLRIGLGFA
jgi:N-methylhydantoinase B